MCQAADKQVGTHPSGISVRRLPSGSRRAARRRRRGAPGEELVVAELDGAQVRGGDAGQANWHALALCRGVPVDARDAWRALLGTLADAEASYLTPG